MERSDLEFFLYLRNTCLDYIHNNTRYTIEECRDWFEKLKTPYYIIQYRDIRLGYVRTSNETENSIYIGADVAPQFRRRGVATFALKRVMYLLEKKVYYLEVLTSNKEAKSLYDKLGFKEISRTDTSILMEKRNG